MLHLNIRSMPANLIKFSTYMENINLKFPIMAFTETQLTELNKDIYEIHDYTAFHLTKDLSSLNTGHGIAIYVQSRLNPSEIIKRDLAC